METRAPFPDDSPVSIDMAIAALEVEDLEAVLRIVGLWERTRLMSHGEASEWRRRIAARQRFRRLLPVRTLTIDRESPTARPARNHRPR